MIREGQFGNWASPVTSVEPPLDGGTVEGMTGGEYNRVGHYFEGNGTLEVVRKLGRHY